MVSTADRFIVKITRQNANKPIPMQVKPISQCTDHQPIYCKFSANNCQCNSFAYILLLLKPISTVKPMSCQSANPMLVGLNSGVDRCHAQWLASKGEDSQQTCYYLW